MSQVWKALVVLALAILPAAAQSTAELRESIAQLRERRAVLGDGAPNGPGNCRIEISVDIRAEVEIQQDSALLRNLGGQRPQWKRFECTSLMPLQPAGFKFTKVTGRGRLKLTLDPSRGGPAVLQVDDPQPGTESYTIDISWTGSKDEKSITGLPADLNKGPESDRKRPPDVESKPRADSGFVRPFVSEEAVRGCEDAAIDRAIERFHAQAVAIRHSALDSTPGREEWVAGTLETRRGKNWEVYRFSCSVDFRERSMRSVDLEAAGPRR